MASLFNKYLSKALKGVDRVSGRESARWKNRNNVVKEMAKEKITPLRAERMAKVVPVRTNQLRAKLALGTAAAGGAGFLGVHRYHQHKDNEILKRIDKLYQPD